VRSLYGSYEKSQGIKAVSRRGPFGQGWLAVAWNTLIDSADSSGGSALNRGRSLARGGGVQSIAVAPGSITGWVQERGQIYQVIITIQAPSQQRWDRFFAQVRHDPLVAAQLLGGQVPPVLGQGTFAALVPLVPRSLEVCEMHCGCYSWEDPCKHAAAILFLVAEELDRDPRLIFTIRGLDLATLLDAVRHDPKAPASQMATTDATDTVYVLEPLPNDLATFWHGAAPAPTAHPPAPLPPAPPLAPFPFWSGTRPFADVLEPIYQKAATEARDLLRLVDAKPEDNLEGDKGATP
jgi:uncharacterized Zn finger protein